MLIVIQTSLTERSQGACSYKQDEFDAANNCDYAFVLVYFVCSVHYDLCALLAAVAIVLQ